jgi:hypothetical protein
MQFLMDEGCQFFERVLVTLTPGEKKPGYIVIIIHRRFSL